MSRNFKMKDRKFGDKLFDFGFFARLWTGVSGDFSMLSALDHALWDD